MLVKHVPVTLLLGRPSEFVVLALLFRTLLMLGEIARTPERFFAIAALEQNTARLLSFPVASHGTHGLSVLLCLFLGNHTPPAEVGRNGNDLSVLLTDKLNSAAVMAKTTAKTYFLVIAVWTHPLLRPHKSDSLEISDILFSF
jgi:hypothetical protein